MSAWYVWPVLIGLAILLSVTLAARKFNWRV